LAVLSIPRAPIACVAPTIARPGAVLATVPRRGDRLAARPRGAARLGGAARPRSSPVVAAGKASEDASQQQVGEKGYVAGEGVLSMDKLMEVPIRRFKPTSEECPFCRDAPVKENGSKCLGICRNPQNVPGPLVHPHQMQEVEDAVRLQINAMKENNEPRNHHGVQVLWEYSVESGNMERSRYFGISSDMYHYDHFIGKALKFFGPLVRNQGVAAFRETSVMQDGRTMVKVEVTDIIGEPTYWVFIMVKRTFGKYEGCWQSHRILQTDENFDSKYLEFC
jgi:hypothetical protein